MIIYIRSLEVSLLSDLKNGDVFAVFSNAHYQYFMVSDSFWDDEHDENHRLYINLQDGSLCHLPGCIVVEHCYVKNLLEV